MSDFFFFVLWARGKFTVLKYKESGLKVKKNPILMTEQVVRSKPHEYTVLHVQKNWLVLFHCISVNNFKSCWDEATASCVLASTVGRTYVFLKDTTSQGGIFPSAKTYKVLNFIFYRNWPL